MKLITLILIALAFIGLVCCLSSCTVVTPKGYTYRLEVTESDVVAAISAKWGGKIARNVQP